jgi:hypothetical protein
MSALTWGDAERRNDLDDRGKLLSEGFAKYCRFLLKSGPDRLHDETNLPLRVAEAHRGYVALRSAEMLLPPDERGEPLRPEAARMITNALLRGEIGLPAPAADHIFPGLSGE